MRFVLNDDVDPFASTVPGRFLALFGRLSGCPPFTCPESDTYACALADRRPGRPKAMVAAAELRC
jgi:hypothetical protein